MSRGGISFVRKNSCGCGSKIIINDSSFFSAAISFQGASGETAFLSCDIVSEQALFPGSRSKARSADLACDSANAAPQSVSSGTTVNTGINLKQSLFPQNGESRYISLEVAYI